MGDASHVLLHTHTTLSMWAETACSPARTPRGKHAPKCFERMLPSADWAACLSEAHMCTHADCAGNQLAGTIMSGAMATGITFSWFPRHLPTLAWARSQRENSWRVLIVETDRSVRITRESVEGVIVPTSRTHVLSGRFAPRAGVSALRGTPPARPWPPPPSRDRLCTTATRYNKKRK